MLDFLIHIDTEVLLFFNGLHTPWLDKFMMMYTGRFVWIPMYACILYILLRSYSLRNALVLTGAVVLAIVVADQSCATFLRPIFERLRPSNPLNPISSMVHIVDGYRGGSYGFPSCHGSNSFALATITALIVKNGRFTRFIFFWAILNAYTRLYLGVHYPGDLIVGGIIGSAGAALVYHAVDYFFRPRLRDREMHVLFTAPAGPVLYPVLGLRVLNFRVFDMLPVVGATTMMIILVLSLSAV